MASSLVIRYRISGRVRGRFARAVIASAGVVLGCSEAPVAVACSSSGLAAIQVAMRDAVTDSVRTFRNVDVSATDGAFVFRVHRDELIWERFDIGYDAPVDKAPPFVSLAHGRPGTYNVLLTVQGYQPWSARGVVAAPSPAACGYAGVIPTRLTVNLVRSAP